MNLKARTAGTFPAARACCGALQSALPLIPPSNRKSSAAGIASFLCGACRVRFFRDLDEPEANTVAYGGDAYAMRQRVADAQQYALFAQALFRQLVSQALDAGRRTLLSGEKRGGRSGREKRPHRTQPAPRGAHHEQGLKQSDVFRREKMTRWGPPNFRKISSSTRSRVLPFFTTI